MKTMVGADSRADSMIQCTQLHFAVKIKSGGFDGNGSYMEEKNFDPCGDQLGARCISSFNPPKAQETWA